MRNWKKGGDVKRELEENKRVAQNSVLLPTENWKHSCGTISLLLTLLSTIYITTV